LIRRADESILPSNRRADCHRRPAEIDKTVDRLYGQAKVKIFRNPEELGSDDIAREVSEAGDDAKPPSRSPTNSDRKSSTLFASSGRPRERHPLEPFRRIPIRYPDARSTRGSAPKHLARCDFALKIMRTEHSKSAAAGRTHQLSIAASR